MSFFKKYISIFFKGMAMGGADVIPGVSGGTIAFITGIYEELIDSLKSIPAGLRILFKQGVFAFWREVNGTFLLALLSGILVSILSLARVITYLLANHPILVWAFFFGLIVGSVYFVTIKIKKWNVAVILAGIIGIAIAYIITITVPAETSQALPFIFLAGFIAICAMILPGISGSFILLLLGKYEFILNALKNMDFSVIITFSLGCITGLLSFSHLISWLFRRFHDLTIALLAGFMIGSLNKVWPWKEVLQFRVNSHGEEVPFLERSVLPHIYENITGNDPQILAAVGVAVAGLIIIIVFEILSRAKDTKEV